MDCLEMVPLGDSAVLIVLGDRIDVHIHRKVVRLVRHLEQHPIPGMTDVVPAYASVAVFYDADRLGASRKDADDDPFAVVVASLQTVMAKIAATDAPEGNLVEIPVCYGGEFGPDLDEVAAICGLSAEEVVQIHTAGSYLVYMIGFAPGFPYLGGMDKRIAAPRKTTPRLSVPRGSVGIAGEQTGIYPLSTPGGWQLIGRTPLRLFDPNRTPPALLQPGDTIRFYPISRREFQRWEERQR